MALPRENRIPRFDSSYFLNCPKKSGSFVLVVVQSGSTFNIPRFSILIGKKNIKKSTDRNKIRRRVFSIISRILPNIKPADYLIIPKKNILNAEYKDIEIDLQKTF